MSRSRDRRTPRGASRPVAAWRRRGRAVSWPPAAPCAAGVDLGERPARRSAESRAGSAPGPPPRRKPARSSVSTRDRAAGSTTGRRDPRRAGREAARVRSARSCPRPDSGAICSSASIRSRGCCCGLVVGGSRPVEALAALAAGSPRASACGSSSSSSSRKSSPACRVVRTRGRETARSRSEKAAHRGIGVACRRSMKSFMRADS